MSVDLWQGAMINASIWHARSGDVARQFRYRGLYASLPLTALESDELPLRPDRQGMWQLRRRDYGAMDGSALSDFMQAQLDPFGLDNCDTTLITMPRGLLHGFNPVSFWLARDAAGLRAVLAEVSNTFGERHLYLCRKPDNQVIGRSDRLTGEKLFHVSPFLPRSGRYEFRFDPGPDRFGAWVDWFGDDGKVRLQTAMAGRALPLTRINLRRAALRHPFQPLRVTGLIHWQAAKLFARGVRYRSKPPQHALRQSQASASPATITENGDA